jgi:4-hydroxybutyryl-CoA dehydratase/vinylacetyl-CoA-Delta-isomerase
LFGKRFEKMAMESADTISDIHGGGSPEAHRVTILRETDVEAKKTGRD